jgi:hypothetical protein
MAQGSAFTQQGLQYKRRKSAFIHPLQQVVSCAKSCEEVVRLVEPLSPLEQRASIAHLQETARHRKLTKEEWWTLLEMKRFSGKVKIMQMAE